MTRKLEYRQFLEDNFKGLRIKSPLFFNWPNGLRFNLQMGETDTDEYFEEVLTRATVLFEASFKPTDTIFLVLQERADKRGKIRFSNYCFHQIHELQKEEVMYSKVSRLYDAKDKSEFWNVAVIKLRVDRINYHQILKAISVVDFPPRQPRIDNRGFLSNKQVFFLNINLRIIYHMYDDRGLDIVASNKETLLPLYKDFNNWILESNRTQIDNNLMKEIDFGLPKI